MGYYTTYILEVDMDTVDLDQKRSLEGDIKSISDYYPFHRYQIGYTLETDPIKWYSHNTDMLKLSSKYPLVEFILEGYGEERDDVWRKYYKNGKVKRIEPQIIWPNREEIEKMGWT